VAYSPIAKWRIKNFRNIADITLDFTKSPIISLVGENECGKTSVVKTFDVVGYNGNSRGQKGYIRDDTKGFGIAGEFLDGSEITRIKTATTNVFKVDVPGKESWSTNKMDSNDVPPEVQAIMGMIMEKETKEPLHVRTYENQLLFVLTKASENYKVMYNALKVDNLTKAIKDGSREANELKSNIKSNEISIDTLNSNIKGIHIVDIEPALTIKNRLKAELGQLEKLEAALRLVDRNNELNKQLGTLAELSKVKEVNISEVDKLQQFNNINKKLSKLINRQDRYKDIESLESIDLTKDQKISAVMVYVQRNNNLEKLRVRYDGVKGLGEVNIAQLINLNKCRKLVNHNNRLIKQNEKYNCYDLDPIDLKELQFIQSMKKVTQLVDINNNHLEENQALHDKVHELQDKIKACGAVVAVCPNCKTDVIMEV